MINTYNGTLVNHKKMKLDILTLQMFKSHDCRLQTEEASFSKALFLPNLYPSIPGTVVKNLPANPEDTRDERLIPGLERFPGERNDNPLQNFCLKNSMVRGAW